MRTFIVYEAPHKLRGTLADLCDTLGADRKIAICRELTKINEEILRTTLGEACDVYSEREPRGEYVLVIDGAKDAPSETKDAVIDKDELKRAVDELCQAGKSKNSAIKSVAEANGMTRNQLYAMLIEK